MDRLITLCRQWLYPIIIAALILANVIVQNALAQTPATAAVASGTAVSQTTTPASAAGPAAPTVDPAVGVPVSVTPIQPLEPAETSAAEKPAVETPDTTANEKDYTLDLEIIGLVHYNVFHFLPKANKIFEVHYGPFKSFSYGPYQVKQSIYHEPWLPLTEIDKRIFVLEETIRTMEKTEEGYLQRRIHLADLKGIQARASLKRDAIQVAIEAYAQVYNDVDKEFYPYVALNLANTLLLANDVITAFPIIKKVTKEFGADKEFKYALNDSLIELYFIAERYKKAWDDLSEQEKNKEIAKQSLDYRLRVGDILFFMGRYQESSDWYQAVLKPEVTKSLSQNVSWLYLAESVYQLGQKDVSRKIYAAMVPFFEKTVYADVIAYRLDPSRDKGDKILRTTRSRVIKDWLHVEMIKDQFHQTPGLFTGEGFDDLLLDRKFPVELQHQIWAMQAYSYEHEKKYYKAIRLYQQLELASHNPVLDKTLDKRIIAALTQKGFQSASEKQAYAFLKFMRRFEFRMRTMNPDKVYDLMWHNLELMGMSDMAAEMTLHIVDKSIHSQKDKSHIYLRLAQALFEARSDQSALKALELVDTKLVDFSDKEIYYKLTLRGLERTKHYKDALAILTQWEAEGASAKNVYWIALRKAEIFIAMGKVTTALSVVDDSVGNGKIDFLPQEYDEFINPLLAYQVILNNKAEKNFEALANFYSNQDRILSTKYKYNAVLASISSALAMNKKNDVAKLMTIAKNHFDDETYKFLDQWTKGEMWINQVSAYLDDPENVRMQNGTIVDPGMEKNKGNDG